MVVVDVDRARQSRVDGKARRVGKTESILPSARRKRRPSHRPDAFYLASQRGGGGWWGGEHMQPFDMVKSNIDPGRACIIDVFKLR